MNDCRVLENDPIPWTLICTQRHAEPLKGEEEQKIDPPFLTAMDILKNLN
jgi:hypothetical protein